MNRERRRLIRGGTVSMRVLWLGALMALVSCRPSPSPETDQAEVTAALADYGDLVLAMAHDRIADTYTPDGEMSHAGQSAFHGPQAIRAHLSSFAEFKVLGSRMTAESTTVTADTASQRGTYWQSVRLPSGETVEVEGRFEASWLRTAPGQWKLRRMATRPLDKEEP